MTSKPEVWQDETVQALKQGYQETIDELKIEIEAEQKRGDMHADINRRAAEALGKPFAGDGSSWHDIPECIAQLKAERETLWQVAVLALKAVLEVDSNEMKPNISELDHYLANEIPDEMWERLNAAALAEKGEQK